MKTTILVAILAAALLAGGCQKSFVYSVSQQPSVEQRTQAEQPAEPRYLRHTVQRPGETLSHIAQWYTGKIQNWETIASHNRSMDINSLRRGDIVRIPESILITHKPMPQDFVQELPAKSKPAAAKAGAKPNNSSPAAKPGAAKPIVAKVPQPTVAEPVPGPRVVATPTRPEQFSLFEPVEAAPAPNASPPEASKDVLSEIELFGPIQ